MGSPVIAGCLFVGNTADAINGYGGGLNAYGSLTVANCAFMNCTSHTGGGMAIAKSSVVDIGNCTFAGNEATVGAGIGLYYTSTVTATNTIIAFSGSGAAIDGTGLITVAHCDLFGNAGGDWIGPVAGQLGVNGNISADPLLVDPSGLDCHLAWPSPCRDAGDSSAVLEKTDFEGDPRIAGSSADMGADEFHEHLYCLGRAVPASFVSIRIAGTPSAPVTLALGSGILDPPQPTPYGNLYLALPLVRFNPGTIPASGILFCPATVPATWIPGEEKPLQALVGPPGNPGSTLTNLLNLMVE
jgi:hypothetical protein